mmetsp:Transcript_23235/g.69683  ORF Transcript_23235/g.69683 Transcript_23235/m.69683 type:complete len:734 (-) Transcript_23235:164-2365(-)
MNAKMAWGNDVLPAGGDLPSTAIPRLGVPAFDWMSQGNVYRGVSNGCNMGCCSCYDGHNMSNCCTDGVGTQFPQGTGMAATFNLDLIFAAGDVAATESRAMQNGFRHRRVADYRTGASSVINILRDGRWGRAPETYGECPTLTADVAVAFNKAIAGFATRNATARQYGDYFKVVGTVRHFVAYAGPDNGRFTFDATVSDDDLQLTYLPAWRALVDAGALGGVMSAISALNGVPSAAHKAMLTDVLRGEWGFDGFVVSDCDTISAISKDFHYTSTVTEAAAAALKAGGDINCGPEYALLLNATAAGLVVEADIDVAVARALRRRVQVGALDPPGYVGPYDTIPLSVIDSAPHRQLAHDVVLESVVLLRNPGALLPFNPSAVRRILVVGPTANDPSIQAHTYHGTPAKWITIYDGITATLAGSGVNITYLQGCSRTDPSTAGFAAAATAAHDADGVIFVGGLQPSMEEEDRDRTASIGLPGVQLKLIQLLQATGTPVAVVVVSGGPVVEPWLTTAPVAWVWLSYFGQDGTGVAEILFGKEAPSGLLPFTMPIDADQYGDIKDYSMTSGPNGRTYRYWRYAPSSLSANVSAPVFPFGYGLTYATYSVGDLALNAPTATLNTTVIATVRVHGGATAFSFPILLFGQFLDASGRPSTVSALPLRQMIAHTKIHVAAGSTVEVAFPFVVGEIPGADRQPLPGSLLVWAGDATPPHSGPLPDARYALPSVSAQLNLALSP